MIDFSKTMAKKGRTIMWYNRCSSIFENGHAWTEGDPALFSDINEEDQKLAMLWVKWNLRPRRSFTQRHSSYSLKHLLEADTRIYLTNNQFKDLMLQSGYRVKNPKDLNWYFNVSVSDYALLRDHGEYPQWSYT